MAFSRSRSTTWRWMLANERRRRSRRGGKKRARSASSRGVLPLPPFQPHEKAVTEPHQDRLAMKAMPQPSLILIPAEQGLTFFMKLLDPIAAMGVFHHPGQRRRRREVAPEILPLAVAARRTLTDQPAAVGRSIAIHPPTAHRHKLGAQVSLTAFPPVDRLPVMAGPRGQERIPTLDGRAGTPAQPQAEVGPHRDDLPFRAGFPTIQKGRIIPIIRIGHDAGMLHAHPVGFIHQLQPKLGLGVKRHFVRHRRAGPAVGVGRPRFRQVQSGGDRPSQGAFRLMAIHRHLAVRDFAQRARILARHPHRLLALLGKARIIQHQCSIAFGVQLQHHADPLAVQSGFVPDHLGQQSLQLLLTGLRHDLRQRVAVLVRMFREQTGQITFQGFLTLAAFELDLERFQKLD